MTREFVDRGHRPRVRADPVASCSSIAGSCFWPCLAFFGLDFAFGEPRGLGGPRIRRVYANSETRMLILLSVCLMTAPGTCREERIDWSSRAPEAWPHGARPGTHRPVARDASALEGRGVALRAATDARQRHLITARGRASPAFSLPGTVPDWRGGIDQGQAFLVGRRRHALDGAGSLQDLRGASLRPGARPAGRLPAPA